MLGHRQLSPAEYLGVWRRRWKWALVPVLFGAAAGYMLSRVVPAKFTSTAVLEEDAQALGRVPGVTPASLRLDALREQALRPERLAPVASRFGLSASQLSQQIVLSATASGFVVSANAADAQSAQQICAEVVPLLQRADWDLMIRRMAERGPDIVDEAPADNGRAVSEAELTAARQDRDDAASRFAEFRRQHGAELAEARRHSANQELANDQAQLQKVEADLNGALRQRSTLTETLLAQKSAPAEGRKAAESETVRALQEQLAAQQAQLVTLEARYTQDYPDVVKLKADIAQLQKKIQEAKKAEANNGPNKAATPAGAAQTAQLQQQIKDLDATIQEKTREEAEIQQKILTEQTRSDSLPMLQQQLQELTAQAESAQQRYARMLAAQGEPHRAATALPPQVAPPRVASGPSLPERPSYPDPVKFTLYGAGAGFAIGLLGIIAGEMNDKSLRTEGDVEHFLELPTLAVIPAAGGASGDSGPRGGRTGNRGEKEEGVLADV